MKNLPKEKRDRLILTCLGTVFVLLAMWYGMIGSQKKRLVTLSQRSIEERSRVDNAHRLVGSVKQIEERLATAAAQVEGIEETMATGDKYSWIILIVNKFRSAYNVDIPQFSREVTGEVGLLPNFPYKAATFTIRGSAYFHDFGRFLADFENQFPYLRVQNLEIEPAATTTGSASGPGAGTVPSGGDTEKLSFRMEIVALINPTGR